MKVLGANGRLANAESSMVHENNPDAACTDEEKGRSEVQCTGSVTPA